MQNLSNFCSSRVHLSHSALTFRTAGFLCSRMECFSLSSGVQLVRRRAFYYVQLSIGLLRLFYISIGFDLAVFNSIGKQAALLRVVWFLNLSNYNTMILKLLGEVNVFKNLK